MVMDVKNKAHRYDKPRPSLHATTAMEIYRHGQRNLHERPLVFAASLAYLFYYLSMRLYIQYFGKN